jgi:hypothetical protein
LIIMQLVGQAQFEYYMCSLRMFFRNVKSFMTSIGIRELIEYSE